VRRPDRPDVRRVVLALPNGFTLANLFFGVFAIVTAAAGDHDRAAWYIVISAVCDTIDGRIARATRSGSRFGEELDSLVDAISFGLAPALLMYFSVLRHESWDWLLVFLYAACAVIRLARFNVVQAGRMKRDFIGLPSPMAAGGLATYYWFSQTSLYNLTFLAGLPWQVMLRFLMVVLAFLMISNVPYPAWPRLTVRTVRGVVGIIGFFTLLGGLVVLPKEFFFPVSVGYVAFGVFRAALTGALDRRDDEFATSDSDDQPFDREPGHRQRTTQRLRGRGRAANQTESENAST
jgi:CDP-diacylglycerol--serine O-phosphatidyltransferase